VWKPEPRRGALTGPEDRQTDESCNFTWTEDKEVHQPLSEKNKLLIDQMKTVMR